ncbi:glycosyltransferase family 39 protein [Candidatus Merdisoma sp. JLR.KK006]|uniref:glycosyltransferase family 39 protein n=1 Tax=Candidatus Merdisoma sp. JLR.KK006 TaxID=3112626 RepID=UPI002FF0B9CF
MKSNVWNKLVLWSVLGLLLFLNFYTLIHAASGWIIGIVLFLSLLFVQQAISGKDDRFLNHASLFLWVFIIFAQIIFVLLLHNNIRHDAFCILNQAIEMLDTHQISPTISDAYFAQVPNNYGLTIITYWFLKILRFLGLPSTCFMRAVQLFNIVFIDLSLLFIYLFIRKKKGNAASAFFLFFCAVSPYLYVWTPYYYTSTTSMMFACAAIFIWSCICSSSSEKKQLLWAGLLGFLCITGFKVRATSLIAYIAIILYWSVTHKKGSLKKHFRSIAVFILSALLSFFIWKGIVNHYVPFDTKDTALPITHFIMLGTFGEDGSFDTSDLVYTVSLPTAEAKLEGTVAVIRQRLSENGLAGNIRLLLNKQLNCWADGTDFFTKEHTHCTDFNKLHTYVIGSKSGFLAAYAQIFRRLQLFLTCIYCIFAFAKKRADGMFLMALNLLGGMVFHLLWEAGPFYSIPFTLFSYAVASDAMEQLNTVPVFKHRYSSVILFFCSIFCLFASSFSLLTNKNLYTKEESIMSDFVVNQHLMLSSKEGPDIKAGEVWTQTFETGHIFNVLNLYYDVSNPEANSSVYRLTLSDEFGIILYDGMIYGKDAGYNPLYEIQFNPVVPAGKTVYTISIEPVTQSNDNYIYFQFHDANYVDLYPHGTLAVNGTPAERDLSFRVICRYIGTAASKKEYGLFAVLLLSLELFLVIKTFHLVYQKRRSIPGGIQGPPDVLS